MKSIDLKKPTPGNLSPTEHNVQHKTLLTDRIQSDLCAMREDMSATVPLLGHLKTIAQTNNEINFQLLDQIRQAREEAKENTDTVVEAIERLISALETRG